MARFSLRTLLILLVSLVLGAVPIPLEAFPSEIIVIRHGDKDPAEDWNHNLSDDGLKRALALPQVLLGRYGTPKAIFAPTPLAPNGGNIRSVQTITPTAIAARVNINTKFGVGDEKALAQSILSDQNLDGAIVFITWEHKAIPKLVEAFGTGTQKKWKGTDFDSILVLKFQEDTVVVSVEKENLNQ